MTAPRGDHPEDFLPDGVRPMDFNGILDWFERNSSNPLGTPFYSEDTPQMLAEDFAESFGIDCTPENVEAVVRCSTCHGDEFVVGHNGHGVTRCPTCNGDGFIGTPENVEEVT